MAADEAVSEDVDTEDAGTDAPDAAASASGASGALAPPASKTASSSAAAPLVSRARPVRIDISRSMVVRPQTY
ncbi:hypothetical protein [Bordetella genomosp. 13]|uniref:hypothetical protein n=1 Tax=Bordetella genomosp. 13 TaxID=463040 RepID=UPI0021B64ADC|nr:hypothetical protein [Bordetella genomosp. 13]